MTARFILVVLIILGLFLWISWPLLVETIADYISRSDVRPDPGSFDE